MLMRCKRFWRVLPTLQHSCYSSTPAIGVDPLLQTATTTSNAESLPKATKISGSHDEVQSTRTKKKLVSAVFSSLKDVSGNPNTIRDDEDPAIELKISSAESMETLLSIAEEKGLSSNQALKIVSKLADWTTDGKAKLAEFESDVRFTRLCQKLGHNVSKRVSRKFGVRNEFNATNFSDLGVVLGVAGDDEAAKLVNTITVPQMIKVLSSLAYKKRRSIPLLRSLAFNIGKSTDDINIKDCADALYACFQLSFQDEVLFEKICSDLCQCINANNKPAVIGSIITSLGFLKYKNSELLDLISEWVVKHFGICRIQDIVSLLLTLAAVNHTPANGDVLFKKLLSHLQKSDVVAPGIWLDVVWALVVLNRATADHISSVLGQDFLDRLAAAQHDNLSVISRVKLQNINGAAKLLLKDYNGPFLEANTEFADVQVPRSKQKEALTTAVIDTLTNLLSSSNYINTNINTGMGFIIDGEFSVDSNLTPLPLIDKMTGQPIDRSQPNAKKGTKMALFVHDYHDITRGQPDPVGVASLAMRLAQGSGYTVISVPFNEFNPRDKLVTRVQYLEQQMKNALKSNLSSVQS